MTLENAPTIIFSVLAGTPAVQRVPRHTQMTPTQRELMRTSNLIAAVTLFTILGVLVVLTVVSRADAHHNQFHGHRVGNQAWQWKWQVWLPDKHRRVTTCETPITVNGRREMNWRHNSGTYQGAYGFYYGSWDQFKPVAWWPANAYDATPWQQYQTALAIYRRYGWSGWGCRGA